MIVSSLAVVIGSIVALACIGWLIWAHTGVRKLNDMMFAHRVTASVVGVCAIIAVAVGIFELLTAS